MLLRGDLPLERAGLATVTVGITVAAVVYARGWRRYRLRLPGRFAVPLLAIHLIEHASFSAGALLFRSPVVQPWPSRPRWPTGAMIPYLLAADVQNTALAALLTFSDRVVYPFYEVHSRATAAAALD